MLRLYTSQLRRIVRSAMLEGGLKVPTGMRQDLTPALVKRTEAAYLTVLDRFNDWLSSQGEEPVKPIGPSGSATHVDADMADAPDTVYGDLDYLVSFPVAAADDRRRAEADSLRRYTELLGRFLRTTKPPGVDVDMTLRGSPLQVIINLGNDTMVQVDTVVTHPSAVEWMRGRYSTERGVKGYVTGNLYKALGDYLTLSIGTEGVLVRTKDGKRVGGNVRAGVEVRRISTNFRSFLADIAEHLAPRAEHHPLLRDHPGLDPGAVNVERLALGIRGLALTLEGAGIVDSGRMLADIASSFEEHMAAAVERKASLGVPEAKLQALRDMNERQLERVIAAFSR